MPLHPVVVPPIAAPELPRGRTVGSPGRRGLLSGLLLLVAAVGCTPAENPYVGTWHDETQFLRIEGNGLGDGSVFRKRGKRSCSWVNRGDRIIVTFGNPTHNDVVEARLEADGSLRVWSKTQKATLVRGPLPFEEPAEVEEPPPALNPQGGPGIGDPEQRPQDTPRGGRPDAG